MAVLGTLFDDLGDRDTFCRLVRVALAASAIRMPVINMTTREWELERVCARGRLPRPRSEGAESAAGPTNWRTPQPSWSQTFWLMVPPGLRLAVAVVTNRPDEADRLTDRLLLVPGPTRSVVVLLGRRAAVALVTKRPDEAERFTVRAIVRPFPNAYPGLRNRPTPCLGACEAGNLTVPALIGN